MVANKIDVDYKVTSKSFNFASKRKLPFFFVSASDGTNVVKIFHMAILAVRGRRGQGPERAQGLGGSGFRAGCLQHGLPGVRGLRGRGLLVWYYNSTNRIITI